MRGSCLLRCELKSTGPVFKKQEFLSKRVESRAAEHFTRDLPQAIQDTPPCAASARKRTRPMLNRPRKRTRPMRAFRPQCVIPTQRTRLHASPPPRKRPSCTTSALRKRVRPSHMQDASHQKSRRPPLGTCGLIRRMNWPVLALQQACSVLVEHHGHIGVEL